MAAAIDHARLEAMLRTDLGIEELEVEENGTLGFSMQLENAVFPVAVRLFDEAGLLIITVHFPFEIPADKRAELCELAVRLNYLMHLATLDLGLEVGTALLRTSAPIDDGIIGVDQLKSLVWTPLATADRFYPAFQAVMGGSQTPEDAAKAVEESE